MESQTRLILAYLQDGRSITPLDALRLFDCFRLSARIKDLRDKGFNIVTSMETKEYEDGTKKRFARYWLKEGDT